jgi:putative peptidoglycan lipid II flippase
MLHAGAQWWGARRVGVTLIPRLGWRDPEIRARGRRMLPSFGYATLNSVRYFAAMIVANRVPGGVVAFQLALNFIFLPVGLGAWPISVAMLPQLSRLYVAGAAQEFRDETVKGANLTFFLIVPAAVAYIVLALPLARVVAYGEMSSHVGTILVAASLASLAVGMLGEAASVIGTHAGYARHDVRAPFHSMVVRTVVSALGMAAAMVLVQGTAVLVVLGLAVSAGNIGGAVWLASNLRSHLPRSGERIWPSLARTVAASLAMALPVYACSRYLPALSGSRSTVLGACVAVGLVVFLGLQRAWRSPELGALRQGAGHLFGRP